jgi:hypothetical protein
LEKAQILGTFRKVNKPVNHNLCSESMNLEKQRNTPQKGLQPPLTIRSASGESLFLRKDSSTDHKRYESTATFSYSDYSINNEVLRLSNNNELVYNRRVPFPFESFRESALPAARIMSEKLEVELEPTGIGVHFAPSQKPISCSIEQGVVSMQVYNSYLEFEVHCNESEGASAMKAIDKVVKSTPLYTVQ